MALNSMDAITMMPRSMEAAEVQGKEMHQTQHASDQTAVQFQQKTEQEARQTVESQKSETEEYDLDGSQGGGGAGSGNRKKKKKEQKEAPVAPRSNSSFDIMI
ncbi:MAG: hypothetical protein J1F22_03185 [Lachnospiraceae bacterium]|nr:hypothetical protein [Lachnospiraceae bacterium]